MGLLAALRGSRAADPDPNPGIGGYTSPRGPDGAGGYPGSTSATRRNPQAAPDKLASAPAFPQRYYGSKVIRRRPPSVPAQQANTIPAPAQYGSLPYQGPDAKTNPDRVRDTERRPRIVTSTSIPGGQRQRNDVYYGGRQAIPGQEHTYRSAGKGRHRPPTEVTVPSRYTFGGPGGGTDLLDDMLTERRMPYTGHDGYRGGLGHAKGSRRGAVLDGNRFYQRPDTQVDQGGAFGRRARGVQRHRPTIFAEPAAWDSQFYDTTASTGGPGTAGTAAQVKPNIHVSAAAERRGWRRG